MFNQAAAQRAAAEMLDAAPRIEGGDGSELVLSVKALVDAIMKAGNPDGLVVPPYDQALAPEARYRLEEPTKVNEEGTTLGIIALTGSVSVTVYSGKKVPITTGLVNPERVWLLSLALASAAQESQRLSSEARA